MNQSSSAAQADWERRFVLGRLTVPQWARHEPRRSVYIAAADGTTQIFALDGTRPRQLTTHRDGITRAAISPDGREVWWLQTPAAGGPGAWRVTPFEGGESRPARPGQGPGRAAGLAFADDGTAAFGIRADGRTQVWLSHDGTARLLHEGEEDLFVADISADGTFLATARTLDGARGPDVVILSADDGSVCSVADAPGGLHPVAFAPRPGDRRLLALHEESGQAEPLILDQASGQRTPVRLGLPGEARVEWFPDGAALLVCQIHQARSRLYRYELDSRELTPVGPDRGFVQNATARPDDTVDLLWSSAGDPPAVYRAARPWSPADLTVLLRRAGEPAVPRTTLTDVRVPGEDGPVHALLNLRARPDDGPVPAVFIAHGGPAACATDSFTPYAAAWADQGYAVVLVNYRGSTGYGVSWRRAGYGAGGLPGVADIHAVRERLVSDGVIDPRQVAIAGASFGGYLALLAIGLHPDDYVAAVAESPIADYIAAYEEEPEHLRRLDRALLGGSPDERRRAWEEANPISYVPRVRTPVLLVTGRDDPRCPFGQVRSYARALADAGAEHQLIAYDGGHGTLNTALRTAHVRAELEFVRRQFAASPGRPAAAG
jgi:dipeptidyl aminopeptidase/acylaminoacyl peptidase